MKQTKEQLIKEISRLETIVKERVEYGERVRREFAKAFNWYESYQIASYENGDRKPLLPSWEQIFVEVGKLLAAKTFYNLGSNVSELECAVEDIKKQLELKTK